MQFQLLACPARFKILDQIGRAGDLDARCAHQFNGSRVHHRNVRDRAIGRVLHRDPPRPPQQFAQTIDQGVPSGIGGAGAGKTVECLRFDLVHQPARHPLRRNIVKPAAGDRRPGRELQHAIGQRVAAMMIEKQPSVQSFIAQRRLNFTESHISLRQLTALQIYFPPRKLRRWPPGRGAA